MDANRFANFRQRLFQVYNLLKERDQNGQVKEEFDRLAEEFPELNGEEASPAEEVKALDSKFQALSLQTTSVEKKRVEKKTKEEVKKILAASLENTDALTDYSAVGTVVSTEQDCLEKLRLLNKALVDAKKRLIYFSALQGEVLQKLKNITKCTINELGRKTDYSQSHIYFLMNLHNLIKDNNRLRYSDLPLSFFKNNMRAII